MQRRVDSSRGLASANPRSHIPPQFSLEGEPMPEPLTTTPERAMVFIDLMNIYESMGELRMNTNVDYSKFAAKMAEAQRRLIRCHVYTGAYDQGREVIKYASQVRFFNRVHKMPFVMLKTRPLLYRNGVHIQKGVDTLIATDMVSMAFLGHYDIAFLASGDGDLAPAVEAVKAAGKQIIVAAFPRSRSAAVGNAADHEIVLNPGYFQDCY